MDIALRRFLHNHGNIATEESPKTMPYSYLECLQGFLIVHSTIASTVHSRQLNSLDHHNHDGKYPARSGFELGTSRLQALVGTNEPSGPAPR